MANNIILSIVTTLLDSDLSVESTYESLMPQLQTEVEWVIKNSTHKAKPEIQRMTTGRSIKVINNPDRGLYEGLNQALKYCEGSYIWVVGAGDKFMPGSVQAVLKAIELIELNESADSICFPIYHRSLNRIILSDPTKFGPNMSCPHPGVILKTEYVRELGGFDERYEIAADFDLLLKYFKRWQKIATAPIPIIDFQGNGVSERRVKEAALESDLARARFERTQNL